MSPEQEPGLIRLMVQQGNGCFFFLSGLSLCVHTLIALSLFVISAKDKQWVIKNTKY